MKRPDALIVGAGPAGATVAILLAQAGGRVVLVDKARFPRDKLCGEFVSPEAVRILKRTGVPAELIETAGRAGEVVMSDARGRSVRLSIPAPRSSGLEALGIARRDMDAALVGEASRLGVEVVEGFELRRLLFSEGRPVGISGTERGEARERSLEGRFLLASDGRDSTVARMLAPEAFRGRVSARFGVKAHYSKVPGFGGAVELHFFRGGYVGLHEVGGGRVNVCALIDRSVAGAIPKDPDAIVREVFFRNPAARARLEPAERASEWLAVASLFFRSEAPVRSGVLFLGDAAGTIDPFAGEGMSMAFRSAEIAAEELGRALGGSEESRGRKELRAAHDGSGRRGEPAFRARVEPGRGPEEAALSRYARRWRREFARRIVLCRSLGRLSIRPPFQRPMLGILARFPALGTILARGTRAGAGLGAGP